nr:DUF4219 domain-containing protein [Tanacetum cinerariifolium]
MAQENYVKGCSMQRPPLLKANGFSFWKTRFETYIKSKDIDLCQVIQNGDFYFEIKDLKIKMMKEMSYELIKDNENKQLSKNNEAKMTLYNALPHKEFERFFMCKTSKERTMVMAIEEVKDLVTLPLDELIGNLKVYEMILTSDGVASKPIKEKLMPIALKANVTKGQTNNDSVCQDGSDEDKDKAEDSKNHFVDDCPRVKVKKAFIGGAWSDTNDGDQIENDAMM